MSPEERRERLRSLVLKLMRVRNIRPVEPESFADAAVRAVATTQLKSPAWESVIRRVFQENSELTAENSATEIQSRRHPRVNSTKRLQRRAYGRTSLVLPQLPSGTQRRGGIRWNLIA